MKIATATFAALTCALALGGTTGAWAQTGGKAHKKPPVAAETNRVTHSDFDVSYVVPEGYNDHPLPDSHLIHIEGPKTSSFVTMGHTNHYIETSIDIIRFPARKERESDSGFTADDAKRYLESLMKQGINNGNPLNYQNSAKIEVAGHPALAILCGTSFSRTSDRAIARLIILRHRGSTYYFLFQALDAEFETRVPAFEKFVGSLKFLQPNVEPTLDDKPAPVKIEISK